MDNNMLENTKNRSLHNNLVSELNKLEHVHKTELQMLQNKRKKLQIKLLNHEQLPSMRGKEAWNVRMYETHNPGFCYHRNGQCRASADSQIKTSLETHQVLKEIMFMTDDEVDVEKVLCLHLFAAHSFFPTESNVTTVRINSSQRDKMKHQSKLDRNSFVTNKKNEDHWLKRSPLAMSNIKALSHEEKINISVCCSRVTSTLPTYVLDLKNSDKKKDDIDEEIELKTTQLNSMSSETSICKPESPKEDKHEKKSINTPIFINNEIENVIDSVIEVLQRVNPQKFREMLALARSPSALRKMMSKREIHKFIDTLYNKPFICSSDLLTINSARILMRIQNVSSKNNELPHFVLKRRTNGELLAVRLKIRDTSLTSSLERLFGRIRQNVLNHVSVNNIPVPVPTSHLLALDTKEPNFRRYINISNSSQNETVTSKFDFKIKDSYNITDNIMGQKENVGKISRKTLSTITNILKNNLSSNKNKLKNRLIKDETLAEKDSSNKSKPHVEERFLCRKSTCPACIERLKFVEKTPKHKNIPHIITSSPPNKFLKSPTKLMTSKDIEEMLNIVSQYGSLNFTTEDSQKGLYPELGFTKESFYDSFTGGNKNDIVHSILRKLSNSQRIEMGRKVASIKNRQVNIEGLEDKTSIPITALFDSVLSKESILELTAYLKGKESIINTSGITISEIISELEQKQHFNEIDNKCITDEKKLNEARFSDNERKKEISEVDLLKMKCDISYKELSKRITKFLNAPNP